MNTSRIAIGSRGSALALAQAGLVRIALEREGRTTRTVIVETAGDRRAPDTAWGEGAFVAAIERALLDGRVDVAVHSAKDVPIEEDARLRIAAYLPRADPRDALVVRHDAIPHCLADLPPGTRVGTDSPRRAGFLRAHRPDLIVHALHGNVDTRLRRLDDGETDALVLACAGLDRLDLGSRISERIAPETIPPAPGQGAIAVQIRRDDARMLGLAAAIDDPRTRAAVEAERAFLERSGGGCRAPIGALATIAGSELELLAGHAAPDGSVTRLERRRGRVEDGRDLATRLAAELIDDRVVPRRPRVLVTRPAEQSGPLLAALRSVGLEAVHVPAIAVAIDPPGAALTAAVASMHAYRWALVTSANGARAVVMAGDGHLAEPGGPQWGAIGATTGAVLEAHGLAVAFQPTRHTGVAMAAELPIESGDRVLVVRGDLAAADLATGLRARGAVVDDIVAYRTVEAPIASRALLRDAVAGGRPDAVLFTSGSTVRGLQALADSAHLDLRGLPSICIGPETAQEATNAGFHILAIAAGRSADALARATADALADRTQEIP